MRGARAIDGGGHSALPVDDSVISYKLNRGAHILYLPSSKFELKNVSGSGKDMGQAYVNFTRNCMDQIRSKVNDELWILNFFELSNHQLFCNKLHCNSSIKRHNSHPLTHLDSNLNTPGYDLLPLTHCLAD
uniref:SRCR domain-containing protein n=1 Tax=Timema shepardi TaxID=629360 RepID=A0A7R9FZE6_TIMSH|nr:unnamed protein product [Timema shepardi]